MADPDLAALRSAFEALAPDARLRIQTELAMPLYDGTQLYTGRINGAYGPGSERALLEGEGFLDSNLRGRLGFDLATGQGIASYLEAISSGEAAAFLYGEGIEEE